MTDPDIDLDEFDPPDRPDFRRVGRGVPYVMSPDSDKRVRYSRSSNAGKILDDESNLTDWKLRTVVAGAAQRPELMAMASTYDVDTNKKELRDIAEQCLVAGKGQRRSIIGTAVHSMFDHIDRGDEWQPPPQFDNLVDAYVATLEVWGLVPVDIEVQCVNDTFRLAGTLDRRYRTTRTLVAPDGTVIPIGSVIVADTKTGKELEYASGSYCTQLAAYVDSLRYDVATDEREPWEPQSVQEWALIIHADSAGERVDVYWVDLAAGRIGLRLADEVRQWRRRDDLLILGHRLRAMDTLPQETAQPSHSMTYGTIPLSNEGVVAPIDPELEVALAGVAPPPAERPPEVARTPVDARTVALRHEYLAGRVRAVLAHSDVAQKAMVRVWPVGVAGLKHEGQSWEELDAIERAVEHVETNYSLPFYPPFENPETAVDVTAVWGKGERGTEQQRDDIARAIETAPRSALMRRWIGLAIDGGIDHAIDTTALAHALYEFGAIDEGEWNDDDLTLMLDGSLRALGYVNGCKDLGRFDPEHSSLLMSAAFAITAGNAMLLFDENEQPIVRTNVKLDKGGN